MYQTTIRETLGALRIGAPVAAGPLCVVPLRSTMEVAARYVLLEQALSRGTLTITEVSEGGSVPYLQAVNKGPWPVLIFDGQELVGAKQNRIANATILVGVGKTVLPVSCVEQGRWSHRTQAFAAGSYASQPSLRLLKERQVRESRRAAAAPAGASHPAARVPDGASHYRAAGSETAGAPQQQRAGWYRSDQHEVWSEVQRISDTLHTRSETMAMADTYEAGRDDLDPIVRTLEPLVTSASADTVGTVVFLGGTFVCLDLLQPAKRFAALYPKLIRGYALESLVYERSAPKPSGIYSFDAEATTYRLFAEIVTAGVDEQPAADLGYDVRLETERVSASGLCWQDDLIQLSVFPKAAA